MYPTWAPDALYPKWAPDALYPKWAPDMFKHLSKQVKQSKKITERILKHCLARHLHFSKPYIYGVMCSILLTTNRNSVPHKCESNPHVRIWTRNKIYIAIYSVYIYIYDLNYLVANSIPLMQGTIGSELSHVPDLLAASHVPHLLAELCHVPVQRPGSIGSELWHSQGYLWGLAHFGPFFVPLGLVMLLTTKKN